MPKTMPKTKIDGLRFVKTEPHSFNQAVGDKRAPTAYRVTLGGVEIGTVHSYSEPYWLQTHSGVRYHFVGFTRRWIAKYTDNKEDQYNYSREQAAQRLIERNRKGGEASG